MYNSGMKEIVENKTKIWVEKYKYNTILTLIIFILFFIFGYSKSDIEYKLYVNDNETKLVYGIYHVNNEQYIHIEDLTSTFSDNIYHDKISGKIIITTYNNVKKINKDDEIYTIKKDNNTYFNLQKIMDELNNNVIVSKNKIYVDNNEHIEAIVKNNRTELFDKQTHDVITLVEKVDKLSVIVDETLKSETKSTVNIVVTIDNNRYYGYVLKDNVQYEYIKVDNVEQQEKVVLVKADNKLMSSTDTRYIDMVAINMYRLSGVNSLTKLDCTNNVPSYSQVYATVNNGHTSSNYDPDITTRMLNSEINRGQIIQQLIENIKELDGVNIEFGSLKTLDKQNFIQYIKELAAVLHQNNQKIMVSIPSDQYIELNKVIEVVDYIVVQPYNARTIASKTSGPISSIGYVENVLKDILEQKIDLSKIILEMPAYSILWTERKGTVINAERYNMQMIQEYINANQIDVSIDSVSGQNYFNYTKGITTYKMWLEDVYSIIEKTKLANKYKLAGVSIYKSGMELKEIYKSIFDNLNK